MDIKGALTRKVGPLPGWAWAGLVAGGVALVVLSRRKTAAKPATQAAATVAPGPDYSLGYQQGIQAGQQPPASAPGPAVPPPFWQFGTPPASATTPWIWQPTQQGLSNASKNGVTYPPGPQVGPIDPQSSSVLGAFGWQWSTVPTGYTPQSYIQALAQQGQAGSGGQGGPRVGSRSSRVNHYAHPAVKQQPRFAHFVQGGRGGAPGGAGGPAGHEAHIAAQAQRAGVHPARLRMVNAPGRPYTRIV